ncbi:ABC transporter permease [Kribbella sp. NPDC049174]|uniref:ABC transporter permease n=1 Tax=Kribbella sp. NPDC049174 TaxID=3364112 RepID=UPI003718F981
MTTDPLSLSPAVVPGRTAMSATGSIKGLKATIARTTLLLAVLLVVIPLAVPGLLAHVSPVATSDANLQGPSASHLFGTDLLGRDVLSRTVYGARPVLLASLLGVLLATAAGVAIGVLGGVAPRLVNALVMRLVDVFLALPVLLIALILIATAGSGVRSIVLAIGIAFTPGFARVVESSVRRLRKAEYVEAARVFGSTTIRTSWRHLIPNLLTEVVVLGSSAIGWGVLTATTLSFLGLGVRLPAPDWGSDLAAGATNLADAWWLSTFPGLAIMATILLANFAGDHLMRVLDPREGVRFGGLFRLVAARRSATRDGGDDS